jgi:ubiquinone/menaquinone biosynthesis C-methylase UbiE
VPARDILACASLPKTAKMKDNFSSNAQNYAQFRPHYPPELFAHLLDLVPDKTSAWDCGTGNGQVAGVLADYFETVHATDISSQQLDAAIRKPNIYYSVQPAEKTSFADKQFSLVTVAQAIHWFRFHEFYTEIKRTTKPGGLIAVIGYGLLQTEPPLQQLLEDFYRNTVGPYWDAERRYIDESYQTIPFPFPEITMPAFSMDYEWNREQLAGYIRTWSAVKHYAKRHNTDPVTALEEGWQQLWKSDEKKLFRFPLLLRAGRL